ncbi:MAG: cytosolic protein [Clostridiales bacterium]|nr:cytosolic protein [Clostridiales bacterium]
MTIELHELQDAFAGNVDYTTFAREILQLEEEGVLVPVKARGRNRKTPSLAYKYNIAKNLLREDFHRELQRTSLNLHPLINLDRYYRAGRDRWEQDKPWIMKLDHYLKNNPLPPEPAPGPERSFQITGNEKWYDEEGGRELLEMVNLDEEHLALTHPPDPLMWAANPFLFSRQQHHHLVLENKTPFHALLPLLQEQDTFTALVYGRGKAVISGLPLFYTQTGLSPENRHVFHYFGDIDPEGITIWHTLEQKMPVKLALPFYEALIKKEFTGNKDNQSINWPAIESFLENFTENFTPSRQQFLKNMLEAGGSLPQEALSSRELQSIWRNYFERNAK